MKAFEYRDGNWSAVRARRRSRDAISRKKNGRIVRRLAAVDAIIPAELQSVATPQYRRYRLPYLSLRFLLFFSPYHLSLSLSRSTPHANTRNTFRVFQLSTLRRFRPSCHYPLFTRNRCRKNVFEIRNLTSLKDTGNLVKGGGSFKFIYSSIFNYNNIISC